jgi:hypothetical protein
MKLYMQSNVTDQVCVKECKTNTAAQEQKSNFFECGGERVKQLSRILCQF